MNATKDNVAFMFFNRIKGDRIVEMYLEAGGERLQFPLLPDKISVKTGATSLSLNVIGLGEVKIPRGSTLTGYSWSSHFLGKRFKDAPYLQGWQEPERIIAALMDWQKNGTTLNLMVTGTTINDDVFIESFSFEPFGGTGDYAYVLTLSKQRKLTISSAPSQTPDPDNPVGSGKYGVVTLNKKNGKIAVKKEAKDKSKTLGNVSNGDTVEVLALEGAWYKVPYEETTGYVLSKWILLTGTTNSSEDGQSTIVPEHESTYTVQNGDTLYTIAKGKLGSGGRYLEIYKLNKNAIDKANKGKKVNRYAVEAGLALQLP
ncbi:MAG: SH3 domain-containing protein [Clostridia bacterium]